MLVAWPSWSKALDLSLCLIPNGRESARVRTSPSPHPLFLHFVRDCSAVFAYVLCTMYVLCIVICTHRYLLKEWASGVTGGAMDESDTLLYNISNTASTLHSLFRTVRTADCIYEKGDGKSKNLKLGLAHIRITWRSSAAYLRDAVATSRHLTNTAVW